MCGRRKGDLPLLISTQEALVIMALPYSTTAEAAMNCSPHNVVCRCHKTPRHVRSAHACKQHAMLYHVSSATGMRCCIKSTFSDYLNLHMNTQNKVHARPPATKAESSGEKLKLLCIRKSEEKEESRHIKEITNAVTSDIITASPLMPLSE